jgi:hypothetical protein
MGSQPWDRSKEKEPDEVHGRAAEADALFQSVREKMHGKSSLDFPAILEAVFNRKLSSEDLTELGYKPDADPEELINKLWYALVFEVYFAGHPRAGIRVHLLPRPQTPDCYLRSKDK